MFQIENINSLFKKGTIAATISDAVKNNTDEQVDAFKTVQLNKLHFKHWVFVRMQTLRLYQNMMMHWK